MTISISGTWFSPNIKPTRKGIYPVRLPTSKHVWKCYWRGDSWGAVSDDIRQAATVMALLSSPVQNKAWFGFAEAA